MNVINKFTVSTKKEKRTKKERNGCCYSSFSFTSFCPAAGVHFIMRFLKLKNVSEIMPNRYWKQYEND